MNLEDFESFWKNIVDSVRNNRWLVDEIEFDGCKLEVIHNYAPDYEGQTNNELTIIFSPKDIVWDYERKFWTRTGAWDTHKISDSSLKSLKESVTKTLRKQGCLS